ncbi:uncharacterized protein N0V89_007613 [Didymosphaeria variabile]|uniref:Uncharacterized protein n=1 Tax=Didymosphaeria variabile TaxID=1932322 RepID=A0A9W8XL74_9PLEO|nr:uncharacterized protein N0V89_007613 [Didymosphaeria variabile]KAJ4352266.1 hypothetical protein N0V89_007613 [Didymosphaeria variabile]
MSTAGPARPPDGATALWAMWPWASKNYAAVCEGDVFSVLFGLRHVVRNFEFAPVDGAVCLEEPGFPPQATYAQRLLSIRHRMLKDPHACRFVQFDVKSTTGLEAGSQTSLTAVRQHRKTAFWIIVCASDPSFVSLIPNIPTMRRRREGEHLFAVNSTRRLAVSGIAYGYLDPEHAAHRMPLGLLQTAVERVRACAIASASGDRQDYVNPWTGVAYRGWVPAITESTDDMWPREDTEHSGASLGILALWRELRLASGDGEDVQFDMVGLQPRLADMKVVFKQRQWLIQCKSDTQDRQPGQFGDVAIAREGDRYAGRRGDDGEAPCSIHHFFSSHDRFDFLLYDFRFDGGEQPLTTGFFFLPERVLPDEFFTSSDQTIEASFAREEFLRYYMTIEENGDWARHILDVIDDNPAPRRASRPHRECAVRRPLAWRVVSRLKQLQMPGLAPEQRLPNTAAAICHRRLFRGVLDQCATRLSGIIVVFAYRHAACDFAFAPYAWTASERDAYWTTGKPPVTVQDLPAAMPMVPFYAFAHGTRCDWRGPMLSGAEFRRANSWALPRILLFDATAAKDTAGPLFVIPTPDLSVTARHRREYQLHVEVDKKKGDRHGRVPLVRELLHTGRNIVDYAMPKLGPNAYETTSEDGWGELWALLDSFAGTTPFAYPEGCRREPREYRTTLKQLHERWWEEETRRAEDGAGT